MSPKFLTQILEERYQRFHKTIRRRNEHYE